MDFAGSMRRASSLGLQRERVQRRLPIGGAALARNGPIAGCKRPGQREGDYSGKNANRTASTLHLPVDAVDVYRGERPPAY